MVPTWEVVHHNRKLSFPEQPSVMVTVIVIIKMISSSEGSCHLLRNCGANLLNILLAKHRTWIDSFGS